MEEAPVVFVCCVDLKAYSQASRKARSQEFEDYGVLETLSGRVREPDYRAQVLTQPDPDREAGLKAAVPNVYIAVEHIVLMAAALGLGSCWVGAIRDVSEICPTTSFLSPCCPWDTPRRFLRPGQGCRWTRYCCVPLGSG